MNFLPKLRRRKSLTALLVLPVLVIPLLASPAGARPARGDAVRRAFAHVDASGLQRCRVAAVADATGAVRVTLECAPRTVVVVVRDDRVAVEEIIVRPRARPVPLPPRRDTVVIIEDDCDSDSDSDSDRKRKHGKHGKHGKHHQHAHHESDSDSDSDSG